MFPLPGLSVPAAPVFAFLSLVLEVQIPRLKHLQPQHALIITHVR